MKVAKLILITGFVVATNAVAASFDCKSDLLNDTEQKVCTDKILSQLDDELAVVYEKARATETNSREQRYLKIEQRGWLARRNECWMSESESECIEQEYRFRIAELQSRYQLVELLSIDTYQCESNDVNELIVTRYKTDPVALIASFDDESALMFEKNTSDLYVGRNKQIQYSKSSNVEMQWGYNAKPITCKLDN